MYIANFDLNVDFLEYTDKVQSEEVITECSNCQLYNCEHRGAFRRRAESLGGLGLCYRFDVYQFRCELIKRNITELEAEGRQKVIDYLLMEDNRKTEYYTRFTQGKAEHALNEVFEIFYQDSQDASFYKAIRQVDRDMILREFLTKVQEERGE